MEENFSCCSVAAYLLNFGIFADVNKYDIKISLILRFKIWYLKYLEFWLLTRSLNILNISNFDYWREAPLRVLSFAPLSYFQLLLKWPFIGQNFIVSLLWFQNKVPYWNKKSGLDLQQVRQQLLPRRDPSFDCQFRHFCFRRFLIFYYFWFLYIFSPHFLPKTYLAPRSKKSEAKLRVKNKNLTNFQPKFRFALSA
jgi:hypothetical protein